jgi:3-methyl-2-oxobutanoate hydroxymethyltransferase
MLSSFAPKRTMALANVASHASRAICGARQSSSASKGGKEEPVITAAPAPVLKNISINSLLVKKRNKERISMVTAYDFPSAVHVDKAGIDILLVGDSVGMVELG